MKENLRLDVLEFLYMILESHPLSPSDVEWLDSLIIRLQEDN